MNTPIKFRPGVLLADPSRPALLLSAILDAHAAPPPAEFDGLSAVPADAWGMLGNDQLGDCTCAGVGHLRVANVHASTGQVLPVTTDETVAFYENFGYRPDDPSSDQGAYCQKVLEFWHKRGFLGEKIAAFAKVNPRRRTEVMQAISTLGPLYIGLTITQANEDQFNNGEAWDIVPGSEELGGHCVIVGSYDAEGLTCVTWGRLQRITWALFEQATEEAYTGFGGDNVSATVDLAALRREYTALTGRRVRLEA